MRRRLRELIAFCVMAWPVFSGADESPSDHDSYYGNYRVSSDHMIGINPFIMDNGEKVVLFADYSSGVVRRMFPNSATEFVIGPGFNTAKPAELTLRFVRDKSSGEVRGVSLRRENESPGFAERVALKREEVSFAGADAKLTGTLLMPATEGPHPAIVLLHGSGALTRHSFGPYPHFFTSLGFGVLIYDKRGTGASTGTRTDAGTATVMTPTFYPDELTRDALAAFRLLQRRRDIDPKRIGFWGSSEGGMIATQAAARSQDVAFAINSSGFMGALWETLRYQVGAVLRSNGVLEAKIDEELSLVDLWLQVARTGEGWEQLQERKKNSLSGGSWFFKSQNEPASLEQLRWYWDHVLSFEPLPQLESVTCPVLGVFGELDVLTEATKAEGNMQRILARAGNKNVTIKIFPKAGHSLIEMPAHNRMTPGVFETLRSWLLQQTERDEDAAHSRAAAR